MANMKTLRPGEYKFTPEDCAKGGRAAGVSKRESKELEETIEKLKELPTFGDIFQGLLAQDGGTLDGKPASKKLLAAARLIQIVLDPKSSVTEFLRALDLLVNLIGEGPAQKIVASAELVTLTAEEKAEERKKYAESIAKSWKD